MAVTTTKLGPGELILGELATSVAMSCQLTKATITWDKKQDDDIPVLCGDVVPGTVEYTSKLEGTVFQDYTDDDGVGAYSWSNKGTLVPFTFTPNTTATGAKTVTGMVTIDPLDFGGEDVKGNMTSDFSWVISGDPLLKPYVAG